MAKKKNSNAAQITALLYIVIGALFIIFKAGVLNWLMTAVGVLFIVNGIIDITKERTVNDIVNIAIGAVIILGGWTFVEIVLIVFGVLLALKGLLDLFAALKAKKLFPILSSILTIVAGVLLVLGKWVMLDWFFIALGVLLVIDGLVALFK